MTVIEIRPSEGGVDAVGFADELLSAIMAGIRRAGVVSTVNTSKRGTTITVARAPG